MKKAIVFFAFSVAMSPVEASWWPFGSDDQPRISDLVRPATELIEEAADLADEGKISEAVEKYHLALVELDRIEFENPERAQKIEFQTVRNKRAYVNSAIDSLLFKQALDNAKAVSVTDTTELQKRYDREKANAKLTDEEKMKIAKKTAEERDEHAVSEIKPVSASERTESSPEGNAAPVAPQTKKAMLRQASQDMRNGNFSRASQTISTILAEKPNDSAALILRAAMESEQGDTKKAEKTLDQCIQSNPRSYHAYYNMARLILKTRGDEGRASARIYYRTGRECGGPVDKKLEDALQ